MDTKKFLISFKRTKKAKEGLFLSSKKSRNRRNAVFRLPDNLVTNEKKGLTVNG